MSSLFNLPTSGSVPDPSAATDRITLEEVTPRSRSLSGAVTIEFTSSPSRWFSPSGSYLLLSTSLNSANTTTEQTRNADGTVATAYVGTWRAPVSDDYVMFARNAGAAFFSSTTLSVNGVLMGTLSNPAQLGGVITTTELTKDYCETVGSSELLQTDQEKRRDCFDILDASGNARDNFDIVHRPPLGWLKTMKAFPGARITMAFNVDPAYQTRIITATGTNVIKVRDVTLAAPIANRDVRVKLNSLKYYAAMMTPLSNPPIPSSVVLPMYEIATSAQQLPSGLTAGTLNSLTFNVPASTFKIGVACQLVSAGSQVTADREVQFKFPYVRHLQCTYAGYVAGSGAYTNATSEPERPFTDFTYATLAAQQGRPSVLTQEEWSLTPLYVFRFAKPANDISSSANIRISFDINLTEAVNVFVFAYRQTTCAMSYGASGMVTGAEYAYAS